MVESIVYASLGALLATLLWLAFLPVFWGRAVRLTKKRLVARLPVSAVEIVAGQDRLRAEHAIALRAVERKAGRATAEAVEAKIAAAQARAEDLDRLATIPELRGRIERLEAEGALLRGEVQRTGADATAAAAALAAAKAASAATTLELAELRAASAQALDAARMDAEAARLAMDQARIEAATLDVEIASLRSEMAIAADAARKGAPSAATQAAPPPTANAELLRALRERLDEVADAIVAAGDQAEPARPKPPPGIRLVPPLPERAGA